MILVTGATGFLGKRVCRKLESRGVDFVRTSLSLGIDFREYDQVKKLFLEHKPAVVLNCMAYVGGIMWGYKHFGEIFRNNLLMTVNLLEACREFGVRRLVNPISNCVYPASATIFREGELWNGPMHESVMVYGGVRKMSWVGSWAYAYQYGLDSINLVLSNMYGPEDHFDPERSHALGALIGKMVRARRSNSSSVEVWGTGKPVREWLFVDDGAEAMVRAMDITSHSDPINVGMEKGISIRDLSEMIKRASRFKGELTFDPSKPDGSPHKTVDGTKGRTLLNWKPEVSLDQGIESTVQWFERNVE